MGDFWYPILNVFWFSGGAKLAAGSVAVTKILIAILELASESNKRL